MKTVDSGVGNGTVPGITSRQLAHDTIDHKVIDDFMFKGLIMED